MDIKRNDKFTSSQNTSQRNSVIQSKSPSADNTVDPAQEVFNDLEYLNEGPKPVSSYGFEIVLARASNSISHISEEVSRQHEQSSANNE